MKDKKSPSEQNEKIRVSAPLNKRMLRYAIAIVVVAVLSYILIAQPQQIMSFIRGVTSIFTPVIIGLCVAYIVNLILRPLERFWLWIWHNCKKQRFVMAVKRPLCLILAFLIFLSALSAMVFMVIPEIKDTVDSFDIKNYSISDKEWFKKTEAFIEKYYIEEPEKEEAAQEKDESENSKEDIDDQKENAADNDVIFSLLAKSWSKVLNTTVTVTTAIITAVVNIILGFAIAVYLLAQKERFKGQFGRAINALFEPARAKRIKEIAALTNNTFTNFITGQLTESCILGILCFIGMTIFRMPNAGIISILVAVTALIPIFGAFIGTGIGAFLLLFDSPITAVWFVIFLIVLQQIESNVIYPRVVGHSVGLPSVWVLIAVTIGGKLFNVMGMLFSVPICSVAYVLFKEYVNKKNSQKVEPTIQETDTSDSPQE